MFHFKLITADGPEEHFAETPEEALETWNRLRMCPLEKQPNHLRCLHDYGTVVAEHFFQILPGRTGHLPIGSLTVDTFLESMSKN